uniref:Pentacotripeptide-repeat region of PRORP domain-containing protein n=1 Tax=Pseudo-nitzschia australis TaxID=44445 RepID=A0A7S4ELJ2_9STRA|mmetsp:Transcript_18611/g.39145  ORF Transcript_18611/g.39145 Transcript_18611/m.39145 type:complete len:829 (-) Transcript_18611:1484-3970(-)
MDLRSIASSDSRRAHIILDTMEALYHRDSTNASLVEPNSVSYTTVIEGWYLHKIHRACESDDDKINPAADGMTKVNTRDMDEMTIATKMDYCYSTAAAASDAQSLLNRMIQSDRLIPSASTYLLVCQKWTECSSPTDTSGEHMQRAQSVLDAYAQTIQHEETSSNDDCNHHQELSSTSSNTLSKLYTTVFEGWCRLIGKAPQAMAISEALLNDMENLAYKERRRQEENLHENNFEDTKRSSWFHRRRGFIGPNSLTYSNIIVGISQSKKLNMGRKADAMIERMKKNGVEPDVVVYTSVLNCWAKAKSRKEREMASKRALGILRVMEDSYTNEKNYLLKPSLITYTTAIKAIGYSLDPRAPELAESILKRMYNLTEAGVIYVPPNVATYNAVINALSPSGPNRGKKGAYARKAEALLVEMIRRSRVDGETSLEPSVVSWGSVLRAYSLSGLPDSGEQAQRIVDMLETWYESGNTNVRPNVVCYTTVMSAWARGKAHGKIALQKVNEILTKLEKLYEETLDESFRANKVTYITAMDVYCRKCPDVAGSMSQKLVDHMLELYAKDIGYDRPTRIVFNTLISAWSRSQEPNAAENAEKIFVWLESGDEYIKPDEVTLCAVLNAWANNAVDGGAMRAQQIMDHTQKLSVEERGFDRTIVPWNILIKAWGRSKTEDSVQRAEKILIHLEDQYRNGESNVKPDITTYSSVINCCAYYTGPTDGKSAAFKVAWRTFHKIKDSDDLIVNNIVYGTLFKAIGKLTSRGKKQEHMIKELFLECCRAGQVCNFVLGQVRTSSPRELFRNLVPESIEDRDARSLEKILKKMPKKWSKNVVF